MAPYFEDLVYEKQDYTQTIMPKGDYEGCRFKSCDLSGTDLSAINFIDCHFENCNLSGANVQKTSFRDAVFKHCKLVGVHFEDAHTFLFSPRFENCVLTLSSFYGVKLKHASFHDCLMHEAELTDADCSTVVFDNCDFSGARFENTNLGKADLTSSFHYQIDPEKNNIRKARFSLPQLAGLLYKYDIVIK